MSRPDRPFRSTHVMQERTIHYDYATKEKRAAGGSKEVSLNYHFTTVTSRKPPRPGTPVCWVDLYADGYKSVHSIPGKSINGKNRLHCIPVYLPGEGVGQYQCDNPQISSRESELQADKFRLASEVERLTKDLDAERRSHGFTLDQYRVAASERDTARTEVARLTSELASAKELTDSTIQKHRDQAYLAGRRMALTEVRSVIGSIKEES